MIQIAGCSDVAGLKELWREAFSEEEYASLFYKMTFGNVKNIIYKSCDKIVSMLHYIPCRMTDGDRWYNGAYLYALATTASHRKQGIMRQLIDEAVRISLEKGLDFLFLIPANDSLFEYYEKAGFDYRVKCSINDDNRNMTFDNSVEDFVRCEIEMEEDAAWPADDKTGLFLRINRSLDIPYVSGYIPF